MAITEVSLRPIRHVGGILVLMQTKRELKSENLKNRMPRFTILNYYYILSLQNGDRDNCW